MPRYFLTPASDRGQESATDAVRRQLAAGWYSWGKNTAHVRDLRPGDRICFYATRGVGVVAEAEAASQAEDSGRAEPFPMRFRIRNPHPIDPPRAIDLDLRVELDYFRDRDPTARAWPRLVRSTQLITEHDFRLLTGGRAEVAATAVRLAPRRPAGAGGGGTQDAGAADPGASAASRAVAEKVLGRRMSPATAFKYLERALQEGLGRREFGPADMRQVREFFGEQLSCVFCGSSDWERWDHLVPAIAGGEAVLGNIVPACQPCDDSKGSRAFDTWLVTRPVPDPNARVERLREYQRRFGYVSGRAETRLTPERFARFEDLVRRANELQRDIEAFLRSPKG